MGRGKQAAAAAPPPRIPSARRRCCVAFSTQGFRFSFALPAFLLQAADEFSHGVYVKTRAFEFDYPGDKRRWSVAEFGPVADGEEYGYTVCVQSRVGERVFGEANASATVRALQSGRPPEGWTYVVSPTPEVSQEGASWIIRDRPASAEQPPRNNSVEIQGGPPSSVFDRNPGIRVRYVHSQWGTATDWALALPRGGSAPYQVWARWRVDVCEGGQPLALRGDSSNDPAGGRASIVFDRGGAVFRDASGAVLPFDAGTGIVPVGAVSVEGIRVTADWAAQGWGLQPATGAFGSACSPNLPPPDPVPPADGEAP